MAQLTQLERYNANWGNARSIRQFGEHAMEDINILFLPFRGDLTTDLPAVGGTDRIESVNDSTGQELATGLHNAIKAATFPRSTRWFQFDPDLENMDQFDSRIPELLLLTDSISRKVLALINRSNFYEENNKALLDLMLGGNSTMSVEPFGDEDVVFTSLDYFRVWSRSDKVGDTEMMFVKYVLTGEDAQRFFDGKPGKMVMETIKDNPSGIAEQFEYLHVVHRNHSPIKGGVQLSIDKPWISAWISLLDNPAEDAIVKTSGFDYMPYAKDAWQRRQGEEDGHGLGHVARAPAAGLNIGFCGLLDAFDYEINPALMMESEAALMGDIESGSTISVRVQNMEPKFLRSGTDFSAALEVLAVLRDQLGRIFLKEMTTGKDTQERSARAVISDDNRNSIQLSTLSETIETHLANQFDLTLRVAHEQGSLPEIDRMIEVMGSDVIILPRFLSPFFAAQRLASTQENLTFVAALVELSNLAAAAGQSPGVQEKQMQILDNINFDNLAKVMVEQGGIDHRIASTEEEMEADRTDRAVQAAEARAGEQELQNAQIAQQVQTNLNPDLGNITGV